MPCWRAPRGLSRAACAACQSAGTCASTSQPSRLLCSDGEARLCVLAGLATQKNVLSVMLFAVTITRALSDKGLHLLWSHISPQACETQIAPIVV